MASRDGAESRLLGDDHVPLKLAAILIAAATLRLLLFTGIGLVDDTFYLEHAYRLSLGEFSLAGQVRGGRLGFVLPAALAFSIFGVSELAAVYFSLLCSVLAPLVAFALGRLLFSTAVGLLSAVLVAVFPLELIFATQLYACTVKTFLTGLALLAFLAGEQTGTRWYHFAAGIVFGLAVFVHESAFICLVFYPLYALFVRRPTRAHAVTALGIVAGVALDPLTYFVVAGDPLAHWSVLSGSVLDRGFYDATEVGLNARWLMQPLARLLTEQEFGLFPYLYLPITVIALVRPAHPHQRLLALWVASILLWTYYGTVSPLSYVTLPRHPRYLSSITIPALVLTSSWLLQNLRRRTLTAVVGALCLTSLLCAVLDNGRARAIPFRDLHAYLVSHRPAALAVDPRAFFPVLFQEACDPAFPMYELRGPWSRDDAIVLAQRAGPKTGESRPSGVVHVVTNREPVADYLTASGAELVASFPPATTLYTRVLSTPAAVRLLSLGREEFRMNALREPGSPLRLYRVAAEALRSRPSAARAR